ncbi:Frag1/DRAM/Sfk1 family protein KNAG_0H00600 [Huiozyma naganishii CBS 8797]|uniref:CWH43-like N-terminal domain-containing protein n=1 Tax=Huiozyma naganishii (strain ATCC MYA-139 / BCRC 22969 / CBS 8797 / KCTC 17520 / NBRC 10181 / NCYC 3082 / Yp74L-3) TaxID=1071383 RepID=J7S9G3_HUIN7|nr:hypothetical protein KNAG_0H00600 [Kazachstania naganishii CBS 8797]CCK71476.1 hypothetical protein KNAG_0H00600 [Kazachstania naganishii CBS 8797]
MKFVKPGNASFLVPWIAFIPWYGMLIAMLVVWAAQGHPIYWFMHTDQFPVYISDIGATNLRPLFISCAGWQGIGYVLCIVLEFAQRHWFKMNPWFTIHERNFILAAIVLATIGELGLLFCTIFSTALYPHVHTAMVCIFIVFMFLSICCLTGEYFSMGRHYALIHPRQTYESGVVDVENLRWYQWAGYRWNKFTISAIIKLLWVICAIIWAICFGAIDNNSTSAKFEWLLAFWLGVFFIIMSVDFYLGTRWRKSKYWPNVSSDAMSGYYKFDKYLEKRYNDQTTTSTKVLDEPTTSTETSLDNPQNMHWYEERPPPV